jgi:hypothetical protein
MALIKAAFRRTLIFAATVSVISGAAWGVRRAMRSPMFTLQVVEVADQPENSPVDAQALADLASLPVGQINLFDLELKPIEQRLLTQPWIREVRLEKHFPQTLSIGVVFREPQALIQNEDGTLAYVDRDGFVFGRVNLQFQPDLPIISAMGSGGASHVTEALTLIKAWGDSDLSAAAQISSLQWDAERGFRVLATYPLLAVAAVPETNGSAGPPVANGVRGRTVVDLGQDLDGEAQLRRLTKVFQYLTANKVHARQIWADSGKKVVVRTVHGS